MGGVREYLEELGEGNYVVKADGLSGGKGVKVAGDHLASIDEAVEYCKECLPKFVLCEKLQGEVRSFYLILSVIAIADDSCLLAACLPLYCQTLSHADRLAFRTPTRSPASL